MQLKKMIAPALKFVRELLLFCSVGALCGAAIGFLMYLHLGPFKNSEDAGFAAGLFVKSGVQLGFLVWMIHVMVLGLRRRIFGSPKKIT
jgi:threonine/homoserine/homoserine lactone efflux protein